MGSGNTGSKSLDRVDSTYKMNLSKKEMQDINGGFFWWIIGGLAYDILSNAPESAESFGRGFERGSSIF